jgi:hypothetical protein
VWCKALELGVRVYPQRNASSAVALLASHNLASNRTDCKRFICFEISRARVGKYRYEWENAARGPRGDGFTTLALDGREVDLRVRPPHFPGMRGFQVHGDTDEWQQPSAAGVYEETQVQFYCADGGVS